MMKQKKVPMRMCVGCREMKPKRELLRVVRSPEGEISFDLTGAKRAAARMCAAARIACKRPFASISWSVRSQRRCPMRCATR